MIYSDAIKADAVQMVRDGAEYIDIAIKLGPSATTCRAWARAAGVPPRSKAHKVPDYPESTRALARKLRSEGKSYRQIMAATGASHDAIWRWTKRGQP